MKINHSEKKKILFVEASLGFGGSLISLSETISGFSKYRPVIIIYHTEGITHLSEQAKVYYIKKRFRSIDKNNFTDALEKNIPFKLLRSILFKSYLALGLLYEAVLQWRIRSIARKENISLIHGNNTINPSLARTARKLRVPCVFHLRGFYGDQNAIQNALRDISKIITISSAITSYAVTSLGIPNKKVVQIYNPVDTKKYELARKPEAVRALYGINPAAHVVAMFARIVPWKGQIEFVKAVILLLSKGIKVTAMIVGKESDGDVTYIESVRRYIDQSGFAASFIFTGYHDRVEDLYNATDIVVHASIEPEPLGRVILEAWAASKPVVSTTAGAPKELIVDGETGFLIPPHDPERMADAIFRLVNDHELRFEMGVRGNAQAKKKFSIASTAMKVEALYDELLLSGGEYV